MSDRPDLGDQRRRLDNNFMTEAPSQPQNEVSWKSPRGRPTESSSATGPLPPINKKPNFLERILQSKREKDARKLQAQKEKLLNSNLNASYTGSRASFDSDDNAMDVTSKRMISHNIHVDEFGNEESDLKIKNKKTDEEVKVPPIQVKKAAPKPPAPKLGHLNFLKNLVNAGAKKPSGGEDNFLPKDLGGTGFVTNDRRQSVLDSQLVNDLHNNNFEEDEYNPGRNSHESSSVQISKAEQFKNSVIYKRREIFENMMKTKLIKGLLSKYGKPKPMSKSMNLINMNWKFAVFEINQRRYHMFQNKSNLDLSRVPISMDDEILII